MLLKMTSLNKSTRRRNKHTESTVKTVLQVSFRMPCLDVFLENTAVEVASLKMCV